MICEGTECMARTDSTALDRAYNTGTYIMCAACAERLRSRRPEKFGVLKRDAGFEVLIIIEGSADRIRAAGYSDE